MITLTEILIYCDMYNLSFISSLPRSSMFIKYPYCTRGVWKPSQQMDTKECLLHMILSPKSLNLPNLSNDNRTCKCDPDVQSMFHLLHSVKQLATKKGTCNLRQEPGKWVLIQICFRLMKIWNTRILKTRTLVLLKNDTSSRYPLPTSVWQM